MARKNSLTRSPPFQVEKALLHLGDKLRTARLRRNLTMEQVAEKIGTGVRAVRDAEKGKPATGAAVYFALLWAYDLLEEAEALADPATDEAGLARSLSEDRLRARSREGLDNDF